MNLLVAVSLLCIAPTKLFAYRDGARENSCYDHSIVHENSEVVPCVPPTCPYFLKIKEVVDEDTLTQGNDPVTDYQCGKAYGSKHNTRYSHEYIKRVRRREYLP